MNETETKKREAGLRCECPVCGFAPATTGVRGGKLWQEMSLHILEHWNARRFPWFRKAFTFRWGSR